MSDSREDCGVNEGENELNPEEVVGRGAFTGEREVSRVEEREEMLFVVVLGVEGKEEAPGIVLFWVYPKEVEEGNPDVLGMEGEEVEGVEVLPKEEF
jgi:hypothetical protein